MLTSLSQIHSTIQDVYRNPCTDIDPETSRCPAIHRTKDYLPRSYSTRTIAAVPSEACPSQQLVYLKSKLDTISGGSLPMIQRKGHKNFTSHISGHNALPTRFGCFDSRRADAQIFLSVSTPALLDGGWSSAVPASWSWCRTILWKSTHLPVPPTT